VIAEPAETPHFLILADESTGWKIAGLTQIDRLTLELNEFAACAEGSKIDVTIFWNPDIGASARSLPDKRRLTSLRFQQEASTLTVVQILSTRLFVCRNALSEFPQCAADVSSSAFASETWRRLHDQFEKSCAPGDPAARWRVLRSPRDIRVAERELLETGGKPQDGIVSKYINRPLTRPITRLLLRIPIEPTTFTVSIFLLPILSCVCLARGDYASVVAGTGIYQVYSMLDGCDGEIARAKYLESRFGGQVDELCDIVGALLFAGGVGFGLYRAHAAASHSWVFAAEGMLLAVLIAGNEWALRRPEEGSPQIVASVVEAAYPRHQRLIQRAGLSRLGSKVLGTVIQVTKRDVGILFFLFLALADRPEFILHPWLVVALGTFALNAFGGRSAR